MGGQIESELGKTPSGWFSGKSEPGAGDVSFPRETPFDNLV